MVAAAVIWGFQVALITELLSFAHLYSLLPVILSWVAASAATMALHRKFSVDCCSFTATPPEGGFRLDAAGPLAGVFWAFAGVIFFLTFLVAVIAPPNTSDALAYHMPRVIYWFMHGTVAFFPAEDYHRLVQSPFAEYTMLLTYLLSFGDRFVNLVQWFGFAWSAVAAAGIARSFGGAAATQALAAFVVAVIPSAILQATGAKNDCYLALWVLAACFAMLRFKETSAPFWLMISGASLGLALLTKNTALLFVPFLLASVVLTFSKQLQSQARRLAPAFAILALLIVSPHWVRTYSLSGSPFGFASAYGKEAYRFRNDNLSPSSIAANVLRNASLHIVTPSKEWNRKFEGILKSTMIAIGADPDDPAAVWTGYKFQIPDLQRHEALTGNQLHFLFALLAACFVFRHRKEEQSRTLLYYTVGLLLAALAFSAALRWQPWHTRLHLTLFVAATPLIAVAAARALPLAATAIGAGLLLICAAPMMTENPPRQLLTAGGIFDLSRDDLYFFEQPELRVPYKDTAAFLMGQSCRQIGIDSSVDSSARRMEYPLMALLRAGDRKFELQETGVDNLSQSLPNFATAKPCAIVCLGCARDAKKLTLYAGYHGAVKTFFDQVVFTSEGVAATPAVAAAAAPSPQPSAPAPACEARLSDGWYDREIQGPDWWAWTKAQGTITIDLDHAATLQLNGEILSMPRPNEIAASLSDGTTKTLKADGQLDYKVKLEKGRSVLRFKSQKEGIQPKGDPRTLAIGFRDLVIQDTKSAEACRIVF